VNGAGHIDARHLGRRFVGERPWVLGSVLGFPAMVATAAVRSPAELVMGALLVVAYLGRLVAEDRRVRHQIDSAPTLLRALRDANVSDRVHLILPGVMEVECRRDDDPRSEP
jgi:hypothetical protein